MTSRAGICAGALVSLLAALSGCSSHSPPHAHEVTARTAQQWWNSGASAALADIETDVTAVNTATRTNSFSDMLDACSQLATDSGRAQEVNAAPDDILNYFWQQAIDAWEAAGEACSGYPAGSYVGPAKIREAAQDIADANSAIHYLTARQHSLNAGG